MAYCQKCGTKNEDDAVYCSKCGAPLDITRRDREKDRCEEECAGGKGGRGWAIFWGVIIVLVGLFIIIEVVFKNMLHMTMFNSEWYGWIVAAVIGLFIVIFGIRVLSRR
jgi:uncharacterized membrane protein YvbJ